MAGARPDNSANVRTIRSCYGAPPDNSAKDNSVDLKLRLFGQIYADNSARDKSALFQFPPFKFNFEKAMKFGVVNKSTTLNRFVLHTLQRNITHLAVITRKTNIKLVILKGGNWKRADSSSNNSDRRSHANVLRACQQRLELYTKFRADNSREAATYA